MARNLFGGDIEEEVEEISGRKVIGTTQPIEVIDKKDQKHSFIAKIDTGTLKTRIRKDVVENLKLKINKKEEKPIVLLSFIMDNVAIDVEAILADDSEKNEIILLFFL